MRVSEIVTNLLQAQVDAARTAVRSLITPVFNVEGYGALGDGIANDAVAIQSAVAAAEVVPYGIVFFPRPTAFYNLGTTSINISKSGVYLLGATPGIPGGTFPHIRYTGTGAAFKINPTGVNEVHGFLMENLHIDGNDTGAYGIELGNTTGTYKSVVGTIRGCTFTNFATAGGRAQAIAALSVVDSYFQYNNIGWVTEDTGLTGVYNFARSRFAFNTAQGALLGSHEGPVNINQCYFEQNGSDGLKVNTAALNMVLNINGCDFEKNCLTTGSLYNLNISVGTLRKLLLAGNTFADPNTGTAGNKHIRIVTTGGNGFALFLANNYTDDSPDKRGIIGSNGSNPVKVLAMEEANEYWTVNTGSKFVSLRSHTPDSWQGSTYVAAEFDINGTDDLFSVGAARGIAFANGQSIVKANSTTGAAGYASAAGSLAINAGSNGFNGKPAGFLCTTGGASPTFKMVNAAIPGWAGITGATPSVTDTIQAKITQSGATNVTNFTGGIDGQRLMVLAGDGNNTIVNGATIRTNTGGNIALSDGDTIEFYYDATNTRWVQAR